VTDLVQSYFTTDFWFTNDLVLGSPLYCNCLGSYLDGRLHSVAVSNVCCLLVSKDTAVDSTATSWFVSKNCISAETCLPTHFLETGIHVTIYIHTYFTQKLCLWVKVPCIHHLSTRWKWVGGFALRNLLTGKHPQVQRVLISRRIVLWNFARKNFYNEAHRFGLAFHPNENSFMWNSFRIEIFIIPSIPMKFY
jgi:hypothetical protein